MTTPSIRLFIGAALFAALCLVASAQIQPGAIKAVRVEGDVQKLLADGTQTVVPEGALITEKDTLVTGANSSVVLVFMNGSTVRVGATTRLSIDEFKMDPFAEDIEPGKLEKEPSVSRTSLNVAYGEVVGNVKKLAKGSAYNVHTPVGAAGIRGTTFRVLLQPVIVNGQNTFKVTLSTSEGVVLFTAFAPPGVAPTTAEVSAGTEVSASVDVVVSAAGTATPVATATPTVEAVAPISAAAQTTINSVAAFVEAAVQNVVITQAQAQQASNEAASKTATSDSTPSSTPPPQPVDQTQAVKDAVTPPPETTTPTPVQTDLVSVAAPPGGE